jgi:hypothetical protein
VQAPTLSITELVHGRLCSDLPPEDRAIMIAEAINGTAELEAECEDLRGQLAEDDDNTFEERYNEAIEALRALVDAIDGAKIGKTARVGSLIVVGSSVDFADVLGDALAEARKLL